MTATIKSPRRWVVHSEKLGIFLGQCIGLAFWSLLDAAGQETAYTFPTQADAFSFIDDCLAEVDDEFEVTSLIPSLGEYATIEDCVRAGLPAWIPYRASEEGTIH